MLYGKSLQVNGVNFGDVDESTHNSNMLVNGCMMSYNIDNNNACYLRNLRDTGSSGFKYQEIDILQEDEEKKAINDVVKYSPLQLHQYETRCGGDLVIYCPHSQMN